MTVSRSRAAATAFHIMAGLVAGVFMAAIGFCLSRQIGEGMIPALWLYPAFGIYTALVLALDEVLFRAP